MTFIYAGATAPAVSDITLSVATGEMVTICGRSGSGKSTLLKNLKPAMAPCGEKSGSIYFFGKSLEELPHKEQASNIGYVMQNPENQIVTDKVWHELAFGLECLGVDTATIRLRVAEMASYFGIQNWFHKDVSELSGGEKQLLNLAAVMVMQPEVLILDEPTSQLDPIAANEFLDTVKKINRELGTTVIIAEHRLEQVLSITDRVIVMEEGRVIADDTPANVGAILSVKGHSMFMAMPTPLQAYAMIYRNGIGKELKCPVDVREGRQWLSHLLASTSLKEVMLPENEPKKSGESAVEMKDVWFRYGKDNDDVIRDFSISINKGELFCMVGGNGAGKTTAINIIGGIRKQYRGRVRTFGKIGMLPQNPQSVFVEKILRNDLMEAFEGHCLSRSEKEQRVSEIAEMLEIDGLLDMHPYDLSGGEQQRAALAKVLLTKPEILIMDEPTKGLDPGFKEKMASILRKLQHGGITIIMASHDIEFCCRYADRCAMIFDGKVIACETPRKFFSGNSFYTTAANRMSRHIFRNAVTVDDLVWLVKENVFASGEDGAGDSEIQDNLHYGGRNLHSGDAPNGSNSGNLTVKNINVPVEKQREKTVRHHPKINLFAVDIVMVVLALATVLAGIYLFDNQKYFIVSMLLVIYAMVPFFARFEHRSPKAREIVLLAVMVTTGVVGRAAFFMIPNFKPLVAIIIISGAALGRQAGFLVGAMSAFVSNFLFGQGPWTTWQMLAMALIGYLAGLIFHRYGDRIKTLPLVVFGGLATFFVYGAITDMWTILMMTSEPSLETALIVYGAAVPFNVVHAAATIFFLLLLARPMIDKLSRVRIKYGMEAYS